MQTKRPINKLENTDILIIIWKHIQPISTQIMGKNVAQKFCIYYHNSQQWLTMKHKIFVACFLSVIYNDMRCWRFNNTWKILRLINSMRFPNDMIQRYISEMISHLFTNYQTTHSTHIPNPFIIDDKLLYTMIQNYGQHLSPYPSSS